MFQSIQNKRIRIVFFISLIVFFFVLIKVFYIQVISYDKLNNLATSLWSRNLEIGAERGKIITSDNITIADNLTTVSLVFVPSQIKNKEEVSINISKILGVDRKVIDEHLYKKSSIERVHPEGRQLSYEVADAISKLNYEGVYLLKEAKRNYPYDSLLAHSIGYVGIDNQGLSGLELEYDKYLTGESGAIKYYSDAKGQKLNISSVYEQPTNGMNLYLTVNFDIQESIERELDNAMTKYNADGSWAIAMNPNTGEILGIASKPSFSPSNYQDYSIEEINRNLAIWASYEPGSTFKIITVASSLEEKTVDLLNDTFYDSGSVNVDGARIKCWKHGGHGAQTFLQVIQNSCNLGVTTRTLLSSLITP